MSEGSLLICHLVTSMPPKNIKKRVCGGGYNWNKIGQIFLIIETGDGYIRIHYAIIFPNKTKQNKHEL